MKDFFLTIASGLHTALHTGDVPELLQSEKLDTSFESREAHSDMLVVKGFIYVQNNRKLIGLRQIFYW